jgi:diketogulonate reductase-like aldo/keto reductase
MTLKRSFLKPSALRDRVFLATKVSKWHLRPRDLNRAIDESLSRLRTDYVDLYQIHEPSDEIPLEETLGAMEDLVDAGKVRFIGVSNFSVQQLDAARRFMRKHPIVSNQVRYNIADRSIESELLTYCQSTGVTLIAYSPLGRELRRVVDCDPHRVLERLSEETGKTVPQIVLNWCLCHDGVVAIPKSNSEQHVLENCGASGWRLTLAQVGLLDQVVKFRKRSSVELALRRLVPAGAARSIKRLVRALPPGLRRRIE